MTTAFEANNLCFFTTIVVTGNCKGVVVGTADNTAMGQIAGLTTETTNDASPIAQEIEKFIHLISAVAIVLGITFLIIGFVLGTEPISNVVFMIGIIVDNVPEDPGAEHPSTKLQSTRLVGEDEHVDDKNFLDLEEDGYGQ